MKPIWIVDDDQSIRFVLERALAREQLAVRSFSNPRDVLAALEDDAPQVLVSDIRMPGGSGIDLLNKVKQKLPGLPVIIMTAYSDLDSAVSAFQGGAFEYLPKPFDLPKAVELIRRALDESLREAVGDVAGAVLEPGLLHDDVDRARDLPKDRRSANDSNCGGRNARDVIVGTVRVRLDRAGDHACQRVDSQAALPPAIPVRGEDRYKMPARTTPARRSRCDCDCRHTDLPSKPCHTNRPEAARLARRWF